MGSWNYYWSKLSGIYKKLLIVCKIDAWACKLLLVAMQPLFINCLDGAIHTFSLGTSLLLVGEDLGTCGEMGAGYVTVPIFPANWAYSF